MAEHNGTNPPASGAEYQFRLFVSGSTPRSLRVISIVRGLCERLFAGRYQLDIVDVFDHPTAARAEQVVAVPTLIVKTPRPRRFFVGDLSDITPLLSSLGLADPA